MEVQAQMSQILPLKLLIHDTQKNMHRKTMHTRFYKSYLSPNLVLRIMEESTLNMASGPMGFKDYSEEYTQVDHTRPVTWMVILEDVTVISVLMIWCLVIPFPTTASI